MLLATDSVPRISWYESAEECRRNAWVQAFHYQMRGHNIEWSGCQAVDARTLRWVEVVR
jgi:hypothetical protein